MSTVEESKKIDWHLIQQANASIGYCLKHTMDIPLFQVEALIKNIPPNERVFNYGALIMAAYMFFLYTKESLYDLAEYKTIDRSRFKITKMTLRQGEDDAQGFYRHLRNSLAHRSFKICPDGNLHFYDRNSFDIMVAPNDFGEFINDFMEQFMKELGSQPSIQLPPRS